MDKKQILKAKTNILTSRLDWLSLRIDKIQPVLKAHHDYMAKIENPHHVNKLARELKLAYLEMSHIDDELARRSQGAREVQQQLSEKEVKQAYFDLAAGKGMQ